jgi:hypothetical protein
MAVMVPWDIRAPGADSQGAVLQELTLAALDRAVGRPKPDFEQLRRGIPDSAAFGELLPRALEQSKQAYFALLRRLSAARRSSDPGERPGDERTADAGPAMKDMKDPR